MNIFDFPRSPRRSTPSHSLGALAAVVTPGVAIVLVTIAIRAALRPLSLAIVRAEGHRRRIAPRLARLRT